MRFRNRTRYGILIALCFAASCTTSPRISDTSPVDSEIFRGEWYDYYNRGMRTVRAGKLEIAEPDLRKAVSIRSEDSHAARVYGVRFQRYYPNRELGIIALKNNDPDTAINRLELSVDHAPTSRAFYFLNQSRRMVILRDRLDKDDPKIELHNTGPLFTSERIYEIRGQVIDDTFVRKLTFNGKQDFFELATPERKFSTEISLSPGPNEILIEAEDLAGRVSQKSFTVELDTEGPCLAIREIRVEKTLSGEQSVIIGGSVYEKREVKIFYLDSLEITLDTDEENFSATIPVTDDQQEIVYFLEDSCGNETTGSIRFRELVELSRNDDNSIQLADVGSSVALQALGTIRRNSRTRFDFGSLVKGQKVFNKDYYINGSAYDKDGISYIATEDMELDIKPAVQVYFGYLAQLTSGTNEVRFYSEDAKGATDEIALRLFLREPAAKRLANRLKLAIYDFTCDESVPENVLEFVQGAFRAEVSNSGRFRILEREHLEKILIEHKISETSRYDSRMLTKLTPADVLLVGTIKDFNDGFVITIRVIGARRPDEPIPDLQVYHYGRETVSMAFPVHGLCSLLKARFPLVKGEILEQCGKEFKLTLGLDEGIRPGSEVYVYRETGEDRENPDIGTLEITDIEGSVSYASVLSLKEKATVNAGDRVIAK